MSQMMMAWGSSLVSNKGLKVTTYLEGNTANNTDSFRRLPNTNYETHDYNLTKLNCILYINNRGMIIEDRLKKIDVIVA